MSIKFLNFFLIFSVFVFGFSFVHYKYPPYYQIASAKAYVINSLTSDLTKFSTCSLPQSFEVIDDSHAFLGHAYGSPRKMKINNGLAKNAMEFITNNKSKLRSITFTGDVFSSPSLDKWKSLRQKTNDNLGIFVAPGNSDVQRLDSRDIFQISEFGQQKYPFLKYLDGTPVIFEDSISNNWEVSNATVELANNIDSEVVIIARHNLPTLDLLSLANSKSGKSSNLITVEELVQRFNKDTFFYWVIGDSGAFPHLPRLSCLAFKNHTFIVNGIGELPGDAVVLFHKGKFYEYEIESTQG